ncbi:MAG: helix-turn-helix domain-containing protein [Oscillospiraceae bacterium]
MEFNEKLLQLRKSRGMTQEELAEALFVSRTAISKWESGRGYPSIDSLKEISRFFSVTIDDLLTGEKLLSIAEKENSTNIRRMCCFLTGITDLLSFLLIFLPLYPDKINGYIYSVNLFNYTQTSKPIRLIYFVMFLALTLTGAVKIVITQLKTDKGQRFVTFISMTLSILTILFLAMTREAYAITVAFSLFVIKGIMLLKFTETKK